MSKKHTIEFIRHAFANKGYTLLENVYTSNKQLLKCTCNKGHEHSICWNDFQQGHKCLYCFGNLRLTYEFVKEAFEKEDYKLLSTEYVNAYTKLDYICDRGHQHTIKWNSFQQGQRCPTCYIEDHSGSNSHYWKGGVSKNKLNLPLYTTYAHKLENCHNVFKVVQDDLELLGVECAYCNKIFVPTINAVQSRIKAIICATKGEHNFYCSENCKKSCSTYGQKLYPKSFKPSTSREVQPQLRKLVLSRDNYECKICGVGLGEAELHCHHTEAVSQNPIESADVDNCVTLCKNCHKQVHKLPGCNYSELRCN